MSKDDPQFNLRIPSDLRRKLAAAAKENNRSVTAEINSRLESTFISEQPYSEIAAVTDIIDRAKFLLKHFRG
ncbi:Arc family DNA-binding protein [Rhizobium laguerreae]|nr:Arc family DNA-binding protein [Rhizobium laguerreae]